MTLETAGIVYDVFRYGIVALLAALGIFAAIRRSRPKASRRDLMAGIVGLVVLVAIGLAASPAVVWLWTAGALVVGVGLGFALGSVRAPLAWVTAAAYVFVAIMALWGTGGAFAFGHAVLGLAVGFPLGQSGREMTGKRSGPAGDTAPQPSSGAPQA